MDEQEAMRIVAACMKDESPLLVNITIRDAWLLVSAIQLATRHPDLSVYMKDSLFSTARQFQTVIEEAHPGAHELLEMGWNTEYDDVDNLDEYDGVVPDSDDDWLQAGEPDDPDEDDLITSSLSEFALIGCAVCGATGQVLVDGFCPKCLIELSSDEDS